MEKILHTNMEHHHDLNPETSFLNIASGALFAISFLFHRLSISATEYSFGEFYDIIYKLFALVSVTMVITINAKKFFEIVKKRFNSIFRKTKKK